MNNIENNEISIQDIFYLVIKGWKVILNSVLICSVIAFVYTTIPSYKDVEYSTNASMVINSKTYKIVAGEVEVSSANDVYLSQKMVNTYKAILISDNVLEKVCLDLGIYISPSIMRNGMTVSSPKDTEVIMVSVINENAQLATDIANSIMKIAPQVISDTVEVGSINVLDVAKVPKLPVAGRKNYLLNMSIGSVLGLMIGGFIVLLGAFLRPKLKSKTEMIDQLTIKCLGELPHVKKNFYKPNMNPMVINNKGDFAFVEGYKNLTETVLHSSEGSNDKTILITSTVPEEGKTNVSVNLALSMSMAGKKVLLVDFDCYKEGVVALFDLKSEFFLKDILDGNVPYNKSVVEEPKTGLHIIFSEKGKFLDMNLMNSPKIKEFFKNINNEYDFIIIDTPPILIQSEAVSLMKYIDGVILVVKQEGATINDIINAKNKIIDVGGKIIGGVINDIRHTVGTEYKNIYDYSQKYHYEKKQGEQNKKSMLKKTIASILFLLTVFSIVYFATRTGEQIIEMSDNMITFIFNKMEQLGFMGDKIQAYDGKISEGTVYGVEISYWAKAMEHWIHTILFFIVTVVTMNLLNSYGIRHCYSVMGTLVLFVILAVGNEYYQSLLVDGRGFEFIDLVFSMLGMVVGFATYWIFYFMTSKKKLMKRIIK